MKKYILVALFACLILSCKKGKVKTTDDDNATKHMDTEIYLTVTEATSDSISLHDRIQFSDNRSPVISLPGGARYYTSIVNPDKYVTWKQGPNSVLNIDIIEVDLKDTIGNKQVLKEKKIKKEKEGLTAKVKHKDAEPNNSIEYYQITVIIEQDTITIDPALQFHH